MDRCPHEFVWSFDTKPTARISTSGSMDGVPIPTLTLGIESPFLRSGAPGLRRAQTATGRVLRVLSRFVLLSPLFVLLAVVIRGYAAVAFVILVALFFAVLNLFFFIAGLHFLRARKVRVVLPLAAKSVDPLGLATGPAVEGTLCRLAPATGSVLWRDVWSDDADSAFRVALGDDFALLPDDESDPIIMRMEWPPHILGRATRGPSAQTPIADAIADHSVLRDATVLMITLRHGDRVAIHATEFEDLPSVDPIELGRGRTRRLETTPSAMYRGASKSGGRLARSTRNKPLALRVLE